MNYGIPYMGSKSKICKNICAVFPPSENFYDLFGGGFSVTHFMLENRFNDFKAFHFNEIRSGVCDLVKDAINGKYSYKVFKPKFITREEFHKNKDSDIYIKLIWSFGNGGKNYLFNKDIEEYKRSLHNAIIFNNFDNTSKEILGLEKFNISYSIEERRIYLRNRIKVLNKNKSNGDLEQLEQLERLERLQQLEQLQQLERLQQLEQLQQLERLQQLEFYNKSYSEIDVKENSVIYCDIPYSGTADYDGNKKFNHKEFFDWAAENENPVYISEYSISDNRFYEILSIDKISLLLATDRRTIKKEKVYANKIGLKKFLEYQYAKKKGR